jgi:uncharacterized protein (DUF1800 family)
MAPPTAGATAEPTTTTGPIRIARFDQEHPAGTPETGPIADLTADPSADPVVPPDGPGTPGWPGRRGRASAIVSGMSRRNLVLAGAVGAATAAGAGTVVLRAITGTSSPTAPPAEDEGAPSPIQGTPRAPAAVVPGGVLALPDDLTTDLLLRRVTYGATPGLVGAVDRIGAQDWLARQLDPATVRDPGGEQVARLFPDLGLSTPEARSRLEDGDVRLLAELRAAHVGRAIWSSRQLFEILVDHWSNVLNLPAGDGALWDTRHRFDTDVVRANALASYEELLVAAAIHPAMLVALDGTESRGTRPNERYARELLEHHTVGADAGFSERDVHRTALLFTGWRAVDGAAVYDLSRHFVGELKIMRFTHRNGSAAEGRPAQHALLRYLANHPRTARTVAHGLAVRFVSDDPPDSLVERLAQVYTVGRTAILPVLRALFSSPELAESAGEKVRRPFERLAATVRALDAPVPGDRRPVTDLSSSLQAAGHLPLASPLPGGYPDVAAAWQSPGAALEQLNATSALVHGQWPERLGLPGPGRLLAEKPGDRDGVVDAVARRVLGRAPTAAERAGARALLEGTRLPATFRAGSAEQEETVALVATLLLCSPSHLTR